MSLLSTLIVEGVRQGGQSALSKALGQAIGRAAGSGIYGGLTFGGGGGGATTAQTQAAVDRARQSMGMDGGTVAPVEITAPVPPPAVSPGAAAAGGGALQQILTGGIGGDTLPATTVEDVTVQGAPAPQNAPASNALAAALSSPTTVDFLDIQAPPKQPLPSAEGIGLPGVVADLATFSNPQDVEPVADEPKQDEPYLDAAMLAVPFAAAGLIPNKGVPAIDTGGGSFLDNLPIRDLIAGGLLGAGLLGGSGSGGGAKDAVKELAENNKNLANRLGNIAEAGFQGNIGGKALNSIRRMVRKAQAGIRQRYAGMGMTGSTAERDDLNDAVEAGVEMQFEIGQKMASTGLNAIAALTGQSAQAYLALMNASTAKDTALGNALANFAGALVR